MISEVLRKSILDYAFKGELVENDLSLSPEDINSTIEKPLYNIPSNWKWARISDVIDISRGASPRPIKDYITNSQDGVNWIKIGDTKVDSKYVESTAEKITKEGALKSRLVHKGDFILSNSMSFGRPYILSIEGCVHDGWLILSNVDNYFYKDYLYYLFTSPLVFRQFSSKATGALVSNLNSDKVGSTIIPIPPLEQQKRIVEKIETIFDILDDMKPVEQELKELKQKFPSQMKKSILNDLFSGTSDFLDEKIDQWNSKPIKKIVDICTGNSIPESVKKSKYTNLKSGYNYIATKDLEFDHSINYENGVKIPYDEKSFRYADTNDILMCIEGGSAGKKIGILSKKVCYGNKLCKFSLLTDELIPKYLYYYLQSPVFLRNFYENLSGMIGGVSISKIKSINMHYPSVNEQERIVEKIEKIFPLCENIEEMIKDD